MWDKAFDFAALEKYLLRKFSKVQGSFIWNYDGPGAWGAVENAGSLGVDWPALRQSLDAPRSGSALPPNTPVAPQLWFA